MNIDLKELFDERLPSALRRNADDAKTIGARFQLNITGATGGTWNIDVSGGAAPPTCVAGTAPADCIITISDGDFQELLEEPQLNAMQFYFNGKLQVTGNQMLALKLQKLLTYR